MYFHILFNTGSFKGNCDFKNIKYDDKIADINQMTYIR